MGHKLRSILETEALEEAAAASLVAVAALRRRRNDNAVMGRRFKLAVAALLLALVGLNGAPRSQATQNTSIPRHLKETWALEPWMEKAGGMGPNANTLIRFRVGDIRHLAEALRIPALIYIRREKVSGVEALATTLVRLVSISSCYGGFHCPG
jgi:hypothetical protein